MDSTSNKILWFLIGNQVITASSRIHGMAVHHELLRLGYNSYVAYLPEFIEEEIPFDFDRRVIFESILQEGDLVILQKIKSKVNLDLINYFRKSGLRIVLIDCDLPVATEMALLCDRVICTSKNLRDRYRAEGIKASFVEDSPEIYSEPKSKKNHEILTCYWFGDSTPQKWAEVSRIESILENPRLKRWRLVTISNHPKATIEWSPDFLKTLKSADVIALPVDIENEESKVKSANRLIQSMALSVPVICSPLLSYQEIISPGIDSFICSTDGEWKNAFETLENVDLRNEMGKAAYLTARKYRIEESIELWIRELDITENYKVISDQKRTEAQHKLNDFFYRPLLKKNIFYWKKMRLSGSNLAWLLKCVIQKLKKRL